MKPANFMEEVLARGLTPRTLDELRLWESLFRNDLYLIYADAEKITPALNPDNLIAEERHGTQYVLAFTSREAMGSFDGEVANGGEWHWENGKVVLRAMKRKQFGLLLNQGLDFEQEVPPETILEILEFNNRPQIATMDALLAWCEAQKKGFRRREDALEVDPKTNKPIYDEANFYVVEGYRVGELEEELDLYRLARETEILSPLEVSEAENSITCRQTKRIVYGRDCAPEPPQQVVEAEEAEPEVEEAPEEEPPPPPEPPKPFPWERMRRLAIAGTVAAIVVIAGLLAIVHLQPSELERIANETEKVAREATAGLALTERRIFAPYFTQRAAHLRDELLTQDEQVAWMLGNEARRYERLGQLAGRVEAHPLLHPTASPTGERTEWTAADLSRDARQALALILEEGDPENALPVRAWRIERNAVDVTAEAFFKNALLAGLAFEAASDEAANEETRRRDAFTGRAFVAEARKARRHMEALLTD